MPLNLVFCGTPRFAVFTLEALVAAGFPVQLAVTQPDRPKGRGLELVSSPVKQSAAQLGLPITQTDTIKNNEEFRAQLTALKPDVIVVVPLPFFMTWSGNPRNATMWSVAILSTEPENDKSMKASKSLVWSSTCLNFTSWSS